MLLQSTALLKTLVIFWWFENEKCLGNGQGVVPWLAGMHGGVHGWHGHGRCVLHHGRSALQYGGRLRNAAVMHT